MEQEQKGAIEEAAQGVLDARAKFLARDGQPGSSLADLYDPLTMPPELLKAHQTLDRLVLKAYGFAKSDPDEPTIVAELLKRDQSLCGTTLL